MKTIVGLGNPGHTYEGTRHNVGFLVIQRLAERHEVAMTRPLVHPVDRRPAGVAGEYRRGQETVRLLMPLTMMNESGEALQASGAEAQDLLIVCDDVHLLLGTLRLRAEGSAGGHHGLHSCLEALGTERVARLRVGVGVRERPADLSAFVLSSFHRAERPQIAQAIAQAVDACETWVAEGTVAAMNQHNKVQGDG